MSQPDPTQIAVNDNEETIPFEVCEYCGEEYVILLEPGYTEKDLIWKCPRCKITNQMKDPADERA